MDPSGLDDIEVEDGGGVYWVPEAGGVGYRDTTMDTHFVSGHNTTMDTHFVLISRLRNKLKDRHVVVPEL